MRKIKKTAKPEGQKRLKQIAAKKNNFGIFGGTFDPIHYGHLGSIENICAELKLDKVLVIPANANPLKEKVALATPANRLAMTKVALATLNSDKYLVEDLEILRSGVSYTITTIEQLQQKYPDSAFTLIVGADQLKQLDQWKNINKILKQVDLAITSRPDYDLPKLKTDLPLFLQKMVKTFRLNKASLSTGRSLYFVNLPDANVSSTDIRRKLRRDETVSHLTPSPVIDYILQNNVYDRSAPLVQDYADFTKFCAKVINDKGGLGINAYDVREMTQPSEFTLVASGTSTRHTKALCEYIVKEAKEQFGISPLSTEGAQEGRWVVVDYGSLLIHIFYDFIRSEYKIEDLWAKAPRLSI